MTVEQATTPTHPAPAASVPPTPEPAAQATVSPSYPRLDSVLVCLAVGFAFLTACFPAANSDLFGHLASGRLLAHGEYRFGHDLFSFTSAGTYWANNSWLYDLALYGLYSLPGIGGDVVVLCKALLLAALVGLMILAGRKQGGPLWVPCAFAVLGVLVLSPRLLLQPICISYLFLVLTWWLLQKTEDLPGESSRRTYLRHGGALLLLFALWVNLDAFFLLGPLTAGLYAVGEFVQGIAVSSRRRWIPSVRVRVLLMVAMGGLVACLANPHFHCALELPWQLGLSPAAGALAQDYEFRRLFGSPLDEVHLKSAITRTVSGLAYFPLIALGLCSFALNYERLRWSRLLVWLSFFALSLANYRMIPFFAVVSAPIASINFLDFAARFSRGSAWRPARRFAPLTARAGVLLAGLVLLLATVPGWLQASPQSRRVGLGVSIDPSLRQAALQLQSWRDQGVIASEERLFTTTPEAAYYFAWFCPEARGFLDLRLPLFSDSAAEYVAVRANLAVPPDASGPDTAHAEPVWRSVFSQRKIHYVVAHLRDPRFGASPIIANRLFRSPDGLPNEWTVCYLDGRTLIARWNGGGAGGAPELNEERLAYGPDAVPVPFTAPPANPWRSPLGKPTGRPLAADEAFLRHLASQGSGSVASLYLALRSARRALAEQPDADTYYLLGQVYSQLAWLTGEQSNDRPFPHLTLLRQTQALAALQNAIRLDPDHQRAHELLSEWARRGMFFLPPFMPSAGMQASGELPRRANVELELAHRREALRCARGHAPAGWPAQMEQQVNSLEASVARLRDQVLLRCQVRQTANRKGRALPYLVFPGLPLAARHAARLEANGSRPDQPGPDE